MYTHHKVDVGGLYDMRPQVVVKPVNCPGQVGLGGKSRFMHKTLDSRDVRPALMDAESAPTPGVLGRSP